jgi:hypothetical protein
MVRIWIKSGYPEIIRADNPVFLCGFLERSRREVFLDQVVGNFVKL